MTYMTNNTMMTPSYCHRCMRINSECGCHFDQMSSNPISDYHKYLESIAGQSPHMVIPPLPQGLMLVDPRIPYTYPFDPFSREKKLLLLLR